MSHTFDQNVATASAASAWVRRFLPLIPKNAGPVLDLACGSGRHTRLLLDAGYEVWALDKDATLLAPLEALGARCFQFDLESSGGEKGASMVNWPFQPSMFSGIIVTNYLHRPLFPYLNAALNNQGVLIYETFALGNEIYGRPKNPHFLLQDGELLREFLSETMATQKNHCIAYEYGYVEKPTPAMLQRICLRSLRPGVAYTGDQDKI
jgi:SAM-dependent methyltransferase